jgi:hypothetical protein
VHIEGAVFANNGYEIRFGHCHGDLLKRHIALKNR